jgi:hypothetical protein
MPKCKFCGANVKAVSEQGHCMACFMKEMNKTMPGARIIGDVADDLGKEQMA